MKRKDFFLVLMAGMLCMASNTTLGNTILYVDDDASLGGDGLSWETAFKYLQDAIYLLEDLGDVEVEMRIAQGTYKPDISEAAVSSGPGRGRDGEGSDSSDANAIPVGSGNDRESFELDRLDCVLVMRGGYAGLIGADPNAWDVTQYQTVLSGDLAGDDVEIHDAQLLKEEPTRQDNSDHLMIVEYTTVDLEGLTFRGGHADREDGGAMWIQHLEGTIQNCRFEGNFANIGAGAIILYGNEGETKISDSHFICNASNHDNGALGGDFIAHGCFFEKNYARIEGGAAGGGTCYASDCIFINNRSDRGGALRLSYGTIVNSYFYGNCAFGGGAIVSAAITLRHCCFLKNRANNGGALALSTESHLVHGCLFAGNYAIESGGGIRLNGADSLSIQNCTIVDNSSPQGSFLANTTTQYKPSAQNATDIQSCIIIKNDDLEIWNSKGTVNVRYSCISLNHAKYYDPNEGIQFGLGNIDCDPCFVDPGYWDDNATPDDPNDDVFIVGDYHLKSQAGHWDEISESWILDDVTSPCIDTGDPDLPIMYEPFPNGGRINMGAYGGTLEASKSYFGEPPCDIIIAGDINGDGRVNYLDLAIMASHWLE